MAVYINRILLTNVRVFNIGAATFVYCLSILNHLAFTVKPQFPKYLIYFLPLFIRVLFVLPHLAHSTMSIPEFFALMDIQSRKKYPGSGAKLRSGSRVSTHQKFLILPPARFIFGYYFNFTFLDTIVSKNVILVSIV
jgi:hypothetical protein